MKKNNKGFTLVELIVVLVILAILAAILVPTLLGYIDRARSEKDFSTAQTVRVAAQAAIDQAYGEGYIADGSYTDSGKTIGTNKVTSIENMAGTIAGGVNVDSNGVATLTNGKTTYLSTVGKYEELVYKLAGVDTTKVTAYSFTYANGIITTGTVTINGHVYKITNGSWTT